MIQYIPWNFLFRVIWKLAVLGEMTALLAASRGNIKVSERWFLRQPQYSNYLRHHEWMTVTSSQRWKLVSPLPARYWPCAPTPACAVPSPEFSPTDSFGFPNYFPLPQDKGRKMSWTTLKMIMQSTVGSIIPLPLKLPFSSLTVINRVIITVSPYYI